MTRTEAIANKKACFEHKIIEVCAECGQAACVHGVFLCQNSQTANVEYKTIKELREFHLENECYWSDKQLLDVYGDAAPFGYKLAVDGAQS